MVMWTPWNSDGFGPGPSRTLELMCVIANPTKRTAFAKVRACFQRSIWPFVHWNNNLNTRTHQVQSREFFRTETAIRTPISYRFGPPKGRGDGTWKHGPHHKGEWLGTPTGKTMYTPWNADWDTYIKNRTLKQSRKQYNLIPSRSILGDFHFSVLFSHLLGMFWHLLPTNNI